MKDRVESLLNKFEAGFSQNGKTWKELNADYYHKDSQSLHPLVRRLLTKLQTICDLAGLEIELRDKKTREIIKQSPTVKINRAKRKKKSRGVPPAP